MSSLLDFLFQEVPNTTIILSTLLPNKKTPQVVEWISDQYRVLAAKRRKSGDRVVLAEMSYAIPWNEMADATHPTDAGYKIMASVWWAAIEEALQEDMIQRFNYTMTAKLEKSLDNSTSNPFLPSYTAPPQPTNTNNAISCFPRRILLTVVAQLIGGKSQKSLSPPLTKANRDSDGFPVRRGCPIDLINFYTMPSN
jgi:hypothetical protein